MSGHGVILKPCPFCGGRAAVIVEPRVLVRCVWVECGECRASTQLQEYSADVADSADDGVDLLAQRLQAARTRAAALWNARA